MYTEVKYSVAAKGLLAAALVVALSLGFAASNASAAEPIKIGYVGGMSGLCGALTPPAIKGMKMAIDEINNSGGILGRKLEAIYRDSKTKADEGSKQARDLVVSEKVDVLTGVCSSSVYLAVNAISKEYNIPLFSAIGGTHKATIEFGHEAVYQTQPHTIMEGNALARFVVSKGWKKIVTMGMDYEWGRTTVQVFVDRLQKLDPSVIISKQLWPKFGESNMTSFITAALAQKPDVIMAVTAGVTTNSLIKQGKSYGMFKRTNVLTFLVTQTLMDMGTEVPDGIYGWSRAPFNALGTKKGADFVKRYRNRYNGEYPTDWGVLGYDDMHYIAQVIERAGSTNPTEMRKAAASFTFDSVRGPLKGRFIDNTLNAPSYIGISKKTPDYPFPVLVDVQIIPGDETLPSEAEVRRLRASVK